MATLNTHCGATVTVYPRIWDKRDGFGNVIEAYSTPADVDNVLIAPGTAQDLDDTRPEGVRVALTLHFPKGWASAIGATTTTTTTTTGPDAPVTLRGAKVTLYGAYAGTYRVVGDPKPYMDGLTPTQWNMPVEVEAYDG